MGIIIYLLFFGGLGYLALRAIRALEVAPSRPSELEALAAELELLREEQQALGSRITAIREGREFARELGRAKD